MEEEESIFVDDAYDNEVSPFVNEEEKDPATGAINPVSKAPDLAAINVEAVLNTPLIFQQQIIKELLEYDSLLIMARGLGYLNITAQLLHILDVASTETDAQGNVVPGGGTVLLLGANDAQMRQIASSMKDLASSRKTKSQRGLTSISAENSTVEKRGRMYKEGGIFSISVRQLLADLLSFNIYPNQITSIILLNPENLVNNDNTQFILRLFRKSNKTASIKAISESPERFLGEFNFQTYLNNLMVQRVMMWPRFHFQVIEDFKSTSSSLHNKVIEIAVNMSESMKIIQTVLIDVIVSLTASIRRMNRKHIDIEVSMDNALERKFSGLIASALGKHRVSLETRSKRHDLAAVEDLLEKLTSLDAVSFYEQITMLRSDNSGGPEAPPYPVWLDEPNGETLRTTARMRAGLAPGYAPELQPKYEHLLHVLDEISATKSQLCHGPVLIMCKTLGASKDLRDFLSSLKKGPSGKGFEDGENFMRSRIKQLKQRREALRLLTNQWKATMSVSSDVSTNNNGLRSAAAPAKTAPAQPRGPNKRRRVRGGSNALGSGVSRSESAESLQSRKEPIKLAEDAKGGLSEDYGDDDLILLGDHDDFVDDVDTGFEIIDPRDITIVRHYQDTLDDQILEELQPSAVIMYEPKPSFLRTLEVYLAVHKPKRFLSYFMYYTESVEEGRYLYEIRKEKDTFTKLIKEKSKLPEVFRDPLVDPEADPLGANSFIRAVNTRIAGGGLKSFRGIGPSRIVFDVRELSSGKLPNALDMASVELVPIQLTVGDFILSPQICVERKSLKDMRDSFSDGRLYSQCISMFRNYAMPVILLEIDEFMDSKRDDPNGEIIEEQFRKKLALLLLFFPKLCIAWSTSPTVSADIFLQLKYSFKEPEPDPEAAAQVGGIDKSESTSANQQAIDTLIQLPGVNNGNYKDLLDRFKSIKDISNANKTLLQSILGSQNGGELYNFFNTPYIDY